MIVVCGMVRKYSMHVLKILFCNFVYLERLLNLLTSNEKPEGFFYIYLFTFGNKYCKTLCFHVSGKNFTGNQRFQVNIYLTHEESPEDSWFCIVDYVIMIYMRFF